MPQASRKSGRRPLRPHIAGEAHLILISAQPGCGRPVKFVEPESPVSTQIRTTPCSPAYRGRATSHPDFATKPRCQASSEFSRPKPPRASRPLPEPLDTPRASRPSRKIRTTLPSSAYRGRATSHPDFRTKVGCGRLPQKFGRPIHRPAESPDPRANQDDGRLARISQPSYVPS
jgi:hypothetical protein